MRLSKTEATVITFLNILIVALVVTVFVVPVIGKADDGETQPAVDVPPEHVKLREASAGKVDEIAWETRLMGSGDETVVDVFFHNGVTYIFGNATVADLDFDSYGGFLCRVDGNGKMLSYTYFDGNIGAVGFVDGGYVVGAGEKLYFVDGDGTATEWAKTDGAAVDIMSLEAENKFAVVTQPDAATLRLTEYALSGGACAKGHSTRIDSGYTLKFLDLFALGGGYCIAARAYALPHYDSCAFFTFTAGGDATARYYGGSGENITRPYAVMPCAAGYFIVAAVNGLSTVLTMDFTFSDCHSINLGFAFVEARLAFDGERYYACFDKLDGAVTYEFKSDLSRRSLAVLDGLTLDCVTETNGERAAIGSVRNLTASLAGGDASECVEIKTVDGSRALDLDIKGAAIKKAADVDGNIILVMSAKGGDALSKPSGGADIYIVAVKAEEIKSNTQ